MLKKQNSTKFCWYICNILYVIGLDSDGSKVTFTVYFFPNHMQCMTNTEQGDSLILVVAHESHVSVRQHKSEAEQTRCQKHPVQSELCVKKVQICLQFSNYNSVQIYKPLCQNKQQWALSFFSPTQCDKRYFVPAN